MTAAATHIPIRIVPFDEKILVRDSWLVLLHVQRIPPHVGMLFHGNYNSLTIREKEMDVELEALLKTIRQRKIKAAFLQIARHPVFSVEHQLGMFQEELHRFREVKQNEASCLSPIKAFFNEFYALGSPAHELLFDFVKRLDNNQYVSFACMQNLDTTNGLPLPLYTPEQLNEKIRSEREAYFGI